LLSHDVSKAEQVPGCGAEQAVVSEQIQNVT